MRAGGVDYSTFRREIWEAAYAYAGSMAKINFSTVEKNGRTYHNLEGVEAANGQPSAPLMSPVPTVTIAPEYQRPKHPDDRRDICRAVGLAQAVASLAHVEDKYKSPAEILQLAEFYADWLNR